MKHSPISPSLPPLSQRITASILAMLPLSLAVIPWGILCGTLSIEAGFSVLQAQLMSLLVFAGAAQIAGITILAASGSWVTLFNSTTMISVRHALYSATYKEYITPLPFYKRLLFAFLLTDEMFVVAQAEQLKTGRFDYAYALSAGFTFYAIWNLATLAGIMFASALPDIESLGFDFAIVATFIAMVIPMIKNRILISAVLVSAVAAYIMAYFEVSNGLVYSGLLGMMVGVILTKRAQVVVMPETDSEPEHLIAPTTMTSTDKLTDGTVATNDLTTNHLTNAKSDNATKGSKL